MEVKRPNVSVIVPVYNAEETIEDCIGSLLNLDYPKSELELIFVNNASTDGTSAILGRFGDRIRVLYEEKRGAAAARNKGILNARGDIVAFTDTDCVVEREWLRNLIASLNDETIGIAGGRILAKRLRNRIEEFGESIHNQDHAINLYDPPHVITMNWASRLPVLRQNLFDEAFIRSQDVDLSYRLLQAGYKFVFEPAAIIYHQNESTLRTLFKEGFTHGFHSVRLIKKHSKFLRPKRTRRLHRAAYRALLSSLIDYLLGRDSERAVCFFVFNLGKRIGKLTGSIRFRYIDL